MRVVDNAGNLLTAAQSFLSFIDGSARLSYVSTTSVQLGLGVIPLKVGGIWQARAVPSAVSLSNGSLSASTVYNVYAADSGNGSTTVLEASATGHVTDASGVEVKSGDSTRTLVGKVRTDGSSLFADTLTKRFVASWWGRRHTALYNEVTSDQSTTSSTFVEVTASMGQIEFLVWGDEAVDVLMPCSIYINGANNYVGACIGIDGAATSSVVFNQMIVSNNPCSTVVATHRALLAEGYHRANMMLEVITGTTAVMQDVNDTTRHRSNIQAVVVI